MFYTVLMKIPDAKIVGHSRKKNVKNLKMWTPEISTVTAHRMKQFRLTLQ